MAKNHTIHPYTHLGPIRRTWPQPVLGTPEHSGGDRSRASSSVPLLKEKRQGGDGTLRSVGDLAIWLIFGSQHLGRKRKHREREDMYICSHGDLQHLK